MKLLHCHIENFGALSDLDLDLREGLHVIREDNGWGKSTLAAFLMVMFYGFANEKKRSIIENERRHYAPWQSGVYGGTVTFSSRGRSFRIERTFGIRDAKEDLMAVYDAETNLPVEDYAEIPGEKLFAIDRESFCRTIFLAQQDCGTQATTQIQAKIGNLEDETADMADYQTVQNALKKEMDAITPHRRTGRVRQLSDTAAILREEVQRRDIHEQTLERLQEQLGQKQEQKDRQAGELDTYTEDLRRLSVSRQAAEDLSMTRSEEERLKQLRELFRLGIPDDEQITEMEQRLEHIREMQDSYDHLQMKANGELEEEKGKYYVPKKGTPFMTVVMFFMFVIGFPFLFNASLRVVGIAILAAAVVVSVVARRSPKIRQMEAIQQEAEERRQLLKMMSNRRKEIKRSEENVLFFLQQFYPDYREGQDMTAKLQQLKYDLSDYQSLSERARRSEEAREKHRDNEADIRDMLPAADAASESDKELRAAMEDRRETMTALDQEIHSCRRQIETELDELDSIAEAEERLAAVEAEAEELRHRYEVLERTSRYLARARAQFTARYMGPIKDAFDEYYTMLAGEDGREYQLDADLKIAVREYGAQRETGLLSEGYQDLIGICRRMAMIRAMYEGEKPFLIFDDPFVNLDARKLERALNFLQRISEDYQVLYFTCHESRVPSAVSFRS